VLDAPVSTAPCVPAILDTSCLGIRLQICRKMLNWECVGLVFVFFIAAVWPVQIVKPKHFFDFLWGGCETEYRPFFFP